jgi:Tfp pilus assembly protein PilV
MRQVVSAVATPARSESGVTLIELLVVMVVALIVFGVTTMIIIQSFHIESSTTARAQASGLGSDMIERMAREVRGACSASIQNASGTQTNPGGRLELYTPVGSTTDCTSPTQHVIYNCTSGQCTRAAGPVGGALGTPTALCLGSSTASSTCRGITNGSTVFSGSNGYSNPPFIKLTLDQNLGSPFSHPLELQDGIALRNLTTP